MNDKQLQIAFMAASFWPLFAGPPVVWYVRSLDVSYSVGVYLVGYALIAPLGALLAKMAWDAWRRP